MNAMTKPATTWEQMRTLLGLDTSFKSPAATGVLNRTPLAPTKKPRPGGPAAELMAVRCKDGERTVHATRLAGALIAEGLDLDGCIASCFAWNSLNVDVLDEGKLEAICHSIFAADVRNHPERHRGHAQHQPLFDLNAGRIDRYINSAPPPRRWLLDGLIALGKCGAVVAPGASSKSQWLLQLGVTVATGVDLADHWKAGETGGVLMLCAEDDNDEIHRRLNRIYMHMYAHGLGPRMVNLNANLFIFPTVGVNTLLTKRDPSGEYSTTEVLHGIVALASQIKNLKLIVIDPLSRFRGGEENSNEGATRFVEVMEHIAKETGATVLAAHHASKASYANADAGQGASRGASALTDGLRWQMNLNPPTEKLAASAGVAKSDLRNYVVATVTKINYSAVPEPVLLERQSDGYLSAATADQANRRAMQAQIARVLQIIASSPKPMTARRFEDMHAGTNQVTGLAKQPLREVLKKAVVAGLLAGGNRQPLSLTDTGAEYLRCVALDSTSRRATDAPTADAPASAKKVRRNKTHTNQ